MKMYINLQNNKEYSYNKPNVNHVCPVWVTYAPVARWQNSPAHYIYKGVNKTMLKNLWEPSTLNAGTLHLTVREATTQVEI